MGALHNPRNTIKTYDLLDQIVTTLGGTKLSFWPILSLYGTSIHPYGSGNDGAVITPSSALSTNFDPVHLNGIYAIYHDSAGASHSITGADNAAYSFGDATVDAPFSTGVWVLPTVALASATTLLSKYDQTTGAEAREWIFTYDASGNLQLELYDEDVNTTEIGTGASDIVVPWAWNFCVATYDGGEEAPVVHLYRNAVDQLASGATTETGAYVAMENTASLFRVGSLETAAGANGVLMEGYLALPFVTGKALSATEVSTLYGLGKILIGI